MTCGSHSEDQLATSRREFLARAGCGFGLMALGLMIDEADAQTSLTPRQAHFNGTAKRVCHIYMSGGQSQQDSWDYKPELQKAADKMTGNRRLLASPFSFKPYGRSGMQLSEVWPNLGEVVDDIAFVNSMFTDVPDHEAGTLMQTTGDTRMVKPSLGSWVVYGLGTVNQNLPGFVSLNTGNQPIGGSRNWGTAFMPGSYQGTFIDTTNTKIEQLIENIKSNHVSMPEQRRQLDLLARLNEIHKQNRNADPVLEARIQSFELAYQMQTEAVEAFDIGNEPKHILELYGANSTNRLEAQQARQMIIARRLLERGVRFVQCWNGGWDHHANIATAARQRAGAVDRPISGFIKDLKQRGMLSDTLVACGTEFGRSSTEDNLGGRTHNARAFTSWLAGGGIKGGVQHGSTDDLGAASVDNKVHVHEFHATILHTLGFDPQNLTYRSSGRDFRLIDVSNARPVKALLA